MLAFLRTPTGPLPTTHARARELLLAVVGRSRRVHDDPHRAAVCADPLASWLDPDEHPAFPETRFATRALAYLLHDGAADREFAKTFWQYQRVRGATFRLLTQDPGTAGLDWFTRFYNRIGFFRDRLPKHRGQEPSVFHALRTQSRDLHLGSLEVRTRPDLDVVAVRDLVRGLARQTRDFPHDAPSRPRPEVALVLHFIKQASYRARGREVLHADPRNRGYGSRHAVWFVEQRQRALAIAGALRDYPELLLVLRGIDVANLEQAQPTWAIAPLYALVREASVSASRRLARVVPSWRTSPLRATLHAGEDYLRVVEGLRRMHEAIEFGLLRHGDRFGHGLAVGADPDCEAQTLVAQPREERLDDLLWELDRYGVGDLAAPASRVERMRREVLQLARSVHPGVDCGVDDLLHARWLRHQPHVLARLGYPAVDRSRAGESVAWRLLVGHLTDGEVFLRGREPVEVRSSSDERAMIGDAQRWLRRELARREITIESNPSSNLLIGDLHAATEHPALRLQPVVGAPHDHPVALSLNTDNPITFASCLADEFAFIYAALLDRGGASSDALTWIDLRREDGWRSRFTLEASASPERLAALLPGERGAATRGPRR
jgi:hypothetical protein